MDTDSVHDTTTVSIVDNDSDGGVEAISIDKCTSEDAFSEKELIREIGSSLVRFELDIACCSEKLVNMNLLMMHVAERESDFEAFALEKEDAPVDYDVKALEFDILSGLFDSEVREMDIFINRIETEINNTCETISSHKHLGEAFLELEEKLHDTEESLKQSQEQVSELTIQSTKFQKILSSVNQNEEEASSEYKEVTISEDGDLFNTTTKLKMQTAEQQRHILRMLEKSLARELELENELKECMQFMDEMKDELQSSQEKVLYAEEETTAVYADFLEADHASAVLMGISKELIGKLQLCQFKANSAQRREDELNTRLQEYIKDAQNLEMKEASMQELAEKNGLEALALKEKVNLLEEKLRASEAALLNGNTSLEGKSDKIKELEDKLSVAESRSQKAEADSKLLADANAKLNEELDILKTSGASVERVDSLEKQLMETDIQLQEAMASVEASQEKQTLLYSSINDMEVLIEKLKSKVSDANARADSAEDKCIILSESHAELNEELNFLRGKLECLETSLQQAEETKRSAAKDISIRTKAITDMVMQLAVERERLHKQLSLLAMENKALEDKLLRANGVLSNSTKEDTVKGIPSSVHEVTVKRNIEVSDDRVGEKSSDDVLDCEYNLKRESLDSKLETVRTIDAGRLNVKYVFSASLAVLIAVLALCFLQPGNCPF